MNCVYPIEQFYNNGTGSDVTAHRKKLFLQMINQRRLANKVGTLG